MGNLDSCRLTLTRQYEIGAAAGRDKREGGNEAAGDTD
jgi:hypothetical protein